MSAATRSAGMGGYPPIGDYALIGDSRGAGLVARDGSLDWLCLPRFDSPSNFAALLDRERGGCFRIRPVEPYRVERRYLPDTNIVETTFTTAAGACALRDLMPVAGEADKRRELSPEHEVLREIEGLTGAIALEVWYDPRPDYAWSRPALRDRGLLGIWCESGGAALVLRSEAPLVLLPEGGARGSATIRAGERRYLSLSYAREGPAVVPTLGETAAAKVARSARWWRAWAGRCRYDGPYRDAVVRSALVLKLLSYAPSGAIIAAPTTSLPEVPGGDKNWDYRYCWLRDASLTLQALFDLGYDEEGRAFSDWLLHATRLTQPELQVLYDVYGRARLPERELAHLEGYAGARPVRVGNGAYDQFQLDVYGEVVAGAATLARRGERLDRDTTRLLAGIARVVCRRWREPDHGIWESRAEPRHYTLSKVLCWVALDQLLRLHETFGLDLPVEQIGRERDAIRDEVERHGYNERLGSYTQAFGNDELDAGLLALPLYGYIDAGDARMRSTFQRIQEQLGRDELLYRDDNDAAGGQGAFGICCFWAVENLARAGEVAQATRRFERLLGYANDVGLFAEEIEPATGVALGNFPQAFTHVGLINAALALEEAQRRGDGGVLERVG